jgi:hypothetical protein
MFPHIFPILLALTKGEVAHFFKLLRRKGLREIGKCRLYRSGLAGEFHFHPLQGEEGISCIPFGLLELL